MKELVLSRGKLAIVDDADFDWLSQWKWSYATVGYAVRRKRASEDKPGTIVYMHRAVLGFPTAKEIDHINRNKLDNRRLNLRAATRRSNAANTSAPITNTSGVVGVQAHRGGWMARCGKQYLGWFKDMAPAIAIRRRAESERENIYAKEIT